MYDRIIKLIEVQKMLQRKKKEKYAAIAIQRAYRRYQRRKAILIEDQFGVSDSSLFRLGSSSVQTMGLFYGLSSIKPQTKA